MVAGNPGVTPNPDSAFDLRVAGAFVARARILLSTEYLPKIERCLEALADDHVWWRANENSNSIGNLLLHLSGNARQWIVSGLGGVPDNRHRQDEFDQRSLISGTELLRSLKETLIEVDTVLTGFDCTLLLTRYEIQSREVSALEAIFHVVEHFSMHTGQIIFLTKLLTSSDLHFYEFERDKPSERWISSPPHSS